MRSDASTEAHREGIMKSDTIVYRILETAVGPMVAGATATGCCCLEFADRGGLVQDRDDNRDDRRRGNIHAACSEGAAAAGPLAGSAAVAVVGDTDDLAADVATGKR